ncbi:hypothetical protein [Pseudooceanicola spongiae]|uniref:Uncharacterized protein n=1 Tax=Pseudooceanicola spongiae TaxID=2613965 RepID=A0A7L9WTL8_9RHOB|nr:hypothetical protein [Pseudooceanicola spongiae]QOL82796.1 hypothetical protein F3W81_19375 [Pseudooceanicola spongiae]
MTLDALHNRLAAFLTNLECLDTAGQRDALVSEIVETGGRYDAPPETPHALHLFEISLHGISASGRDEADAFRAWKRTAHKITFEGASAEA